MITGYTEALGTLESDMKAFVEEAKAGAEGRGSKAPASRSRKLSNKITKDLKTFRKLSIENDRSKNIIIK